MEALLVVGGLGLCYGAPVIVPYVTVWYYGVYPTLVIHPLLFAVVYLAYFGLAVLVGYLPKKDLLRRP